MSLIQDAVQPSASDCLGLIKYRSIKHNYVSIWKFKKTAIHMQTEESVQQNSAALCWFMIDMNSNIVACSMGIVHWICFLFAEMYFSGLFINATCITDQIGI